MARNVSFLAVVAATAALVACTSSSMPDVALPSTAPPATADHPISIIDGEFVDERIGAPFPVRGTNYFTIVPTDGGFEDRFFSPAVFDAARVAADFETLAAAGYTTVRLFLDTCSIGPDCIAGHGSDGLNPDYLASIAATMRLAKDTGMHLVLTSNDLPDGGGYASRADRNDPTVFAGYRNSVFLTRPGADAAVAYWDDLLTGLANAGAPFDAVLAWSIVNELWVFRDRPPLSLRGGTARAADGEEYDMSDQQQRRLLVLAGFRHYLNAVAAVIRDHDPDGMVTAGFFAPQFPNPTATGGDWYVDTAPLVGTVDLDFFDFHAYVGGDLTMAELAENFGMAPDSAIPVVMGETGAFVHQFATAESAAIRLQHWAADSCDVGFDGWLHWGYLRAPLAIGDAAWSLTDDDGYLLTVLSPNAWPDACVPNLQDPDLARSGSAAASSALPDQPAAAAIDGDPATQWGSGGDASQWLQVQLATPATVARVRLQVAQYPAGRTVHEVMVRSGGAWRVAAVLDGTTTDGEVLEAVFDPIPDVTVVRVTTLASPSWVSWRGVEVLAD